MQMIIHQSQEFGKDLMCVLKKRYFPNTIKEALPTYSGPPSATFYQSMPPLEERAALTKIRQNTFPGI
ncbi:hypothetical protein HPB48_021650 [Haemaphysalis longicornis]|uniref:Uncharacterized protein n=1 Tax=Haemaphysalis longicornis TaxID=44386 RepID=A0A9J6F9G5_HAELO|nr:hypothetical protein HPB48_021650 [Haemaphysalis longicornis]